MNNSHRQQPETTTIDKEFVYAFVEEFFKDSR